MIKKNTKVINQAIQVIFTIYFRALRWAAYRQFTWWIHGYLGRRVRRVIPTCVVHIIRKRFPAPEGEQYKPYASDSEDDD